MSSEMREEGVREIVASRATTRVAPTFHVEQTQHVGATLVVALRNFAKIPLSPERGNTR